MFFLSSGHNYIKKFKTYLEVLTSRKECKYQQPCSQIATGLFLTHSFLDGIVYFEIVKKKMYLHFMITLNELSPVQKQLFAIWSFLTCDNCSISLTGRALYKKLRHICSCHARRHNGFVTLPNQVPSSHWCGVFFSITLFEVEKKVS